MASRYEVEVTITSAKDLKNVNWRYGRLKPYAVVWVDPSSKCSTRVDEEEDTNPYWDQTLVIPLNAPIEDSTLYIDIVHAKAGEDVKPLVGSARLPLRDVVDEVGLGERASRKLELKRPSGRPHGKVDIKVAVREPRYRAPDPYYAPPYGVPRSTSRDYSDPPPYGNPYAAPYQAAPPPSGYPYSSAPYGQPQPSYGQPAYGQPQPSYGQPAYGQEAYGRQESFGQGYGHDSYGEQKEEKKSKFGMGTGLAVGAVAGVLGGIAIAEGVDYMQDKIEDDVAERVEDDLRDDGGRDDDDDHDDDDGGYDGDDF